MNDKIDNKYDKKGRPIGLIEWGRLIQDKEYSKVCQISFGGYFFSTVWLGLDHRTLVDKEAPIIFESMAFIEKNDDFESIYQDRYSTMSQARRGHLKMIIKVLWNRFVKRLVKRYDLLVKWTKKRRQDHIPDNIKFINL